MLLIPAIDLKDGQCVRLRQGRMDDTTVFASNPVDVAQRWVDAGARRLHLVDLNGAFAGKPVNGDVVRAVAARFPNVPVQIGGGIRDAATVAAYLKQACNIALSAQKRCKNRNSSSTCASNFPVTLSSALMPKTAWWQPTVGRKCLPFPRLNLPSN